MYKNKDILMLGITPISIAQGEPKGLDILNYKKLAPPWSLINEYKHSKDRTIYTRTYFETVLNKLNQFNVIAELLLLALATDVAILCYEKPDDFCHRHLVADWLNLVLPEGEKVCELEV